MPQLDKITFFNQIIWLLPLLSILYWFLLQKVLFSISTTLKLRARLLNQKHTNNEFGNTYVTENSIAKRNLMFNISQFTVNTYTKIKFILQLQNKFIDLNIYKGKEFLEVNKIMQEKLISVYLIKTLIQK
jgi:hypothetical protein